MADDDEDIAALVVDNGSGMCKGTLDVAPSFVSLDVDVPIHRGLSVYSRLRGRCRQLFRFSQR